MSASEGASGSRLGPGKDLFSVQLEVLALVNFVACKYTVPKPPRKNRRGPGNEAKCTACVFTDRKSLHYYQLYPDFRVATDLACTISYTTIYATMPSG